MGRVRQGRPLRYRKSKVRCPSGKVRYPSAIDAGKALGKAQRNREMKGQTDRVEIRHYFCGRCKGHHLTSMPRT